MGIHRIGFSDLFPSPNHYNFYLHNKYIVKKQAHTVTAFFSSEMSNGVSSGTNMYENYKLCRLSCSHMGSSSEMLCFSSEKAWFNVIHLPLSLYIVQNPSILCRSSLFSKCIKIYNFFENSSKIRII